MTDWWFVFFTFAVGVLLGVIAGYRWGYGAGYDIAEQIYYELWREQEKGRIRFDD